MTEPEDLAAMLVVEFALRYGNDFFLVPLQLPVGGVSQVGALIVTDTFGVRTVVSAAADRDGAPVLFRHYNPAGKAGEAMIVFPAAADGPESTPIEEVVRARDEDANLCWAIEKTAVGPDVANGGLRPDVPRHWTCWTVHDARRRRWRTADRGRQGAANTVGRPPRAALHGQSRVTSGGRA